MKTTTIYTIGHSTHNFAVFLNMLRSFDIKILVDIRRFPNSQKFPQFNKEELKKSLEENDIQYMHMAELGGRRMMKKDSKNTRWNNHYFRGYADYMESDEFENAIMNLIKIALGQQTAIMCSEAVWWRCHRSMVSDYLKAKSWIVLHIMAMGKAQEHNYTNPARIVGDHLLYTNEE